MSKPTIVIDQTKGTIEVITGDGPLTFKDGMYFQADKPAPVGCLVSFNPEDGFNMEVKE